MSPSEVIIAMVLLFQRGLVGTLQSGREGPGR
jgi:hypothetical protein